MTFLRIILTFLEVLCSTLLIGVILLQKTKDEGLGLAFGGGMGESLFGSRAGNVLTKITITLSVIFLVNTVALSILYSRGAETSLVEKLSDKAARQQPPAPAPGPAPEAAPGSETPAAAAPAATAPSEAQPAPAAPAGTAEKAVPAPAAPGGDKSAP